MKKQNIFVIYNGFRAKVEKISALTESETEQALNGEKFTKIKKFNTIFFIVEN